MSPRAKVVGLACAGLLVSLWGGAWMLDTVPGAYQFAAWCTAALLFAGCTLVLLAELVDVD